MIAGQSNATGQGTNRNTYAYSGIVAGLWPHNSNAWVNLADPTDPGGNGSVWPLVGASYLAARSLPVGFEATAVNGTTSAAWLPSVHAGYYELMAARIAAAGVPLKAVLWWQGEEDAFNGVSQATYHANLASIAGQLAIDYGIPLVAAKLQKCLNIPDANIAVINAAIAQAWGDIANVKQGPDLSDMTADSGAHLTTDGKIQIAAARWWAAIQAALYP